MSNLLKVLLGVAVVGSFLGYLFLGETKESVVSGTGGQYDISTPGSFDTGYLINSTSTLIATSSSLALKNATRLTLFWGHGVETNGQLTLTAQVSPLGEDQTQNSGNATATLFVTPSISANGFAVQESLVASTSGAGTSTASIDLRNHVYPFIRFIISSDLETELGTSSLFYIISND